jgi:asparagine synthase (glutamine-hydrolysing)
MCGIFCYINNSNKKIIDFYEIAKNQFESQAHRGPDDRGFAVFDHNGCLLFTEKEKIQNSSYHPKLLIGQTRLSIIDLSPDGHQPMFSRDGRYVIIYNGEVYNYLELRDELKADGESFSSNSDTEVVLAALIKFGPDALRLFEGMFSLALYDSQKKTLFCARDVFGIKPLYWSCPYSGSFALASELPSLLKIPGNERRLNWNAAYNYLACGQIDFGDNSMVDGVHQLAPGYCFTVNLEEKTYLPIPKPYFRFELNEPIKISFEEASLETRRLFLKSVKLHLRADVPLGVSLSGGIDSSSLACAIKYLAPDLPLKTFSFIARGYPVSEESWVDVITSKINGESFKVNIALNDLFDDLDLLIQRQGEPFGSTSIYAQFRVFKLAREAGVVVTLEGQGADELLAGYNGYTQLRFLSLFNKGEIFRALKVLRASSNSSQWPGRSLSATLKRLGRVILPSKLKSFARAVCNGSINLNWINKGVIKDKGLFEWSNELPSSPKFIDRLRSYLLSQLTWAGLPGLLRYADRNSMTFSLESRLPFCNKELTSFILSLPEEYLVSDEGLTKRVFRHAMRGLVPDAILERRDKVGFETPEKQWLINKSMWVEDKLLSYSSSLLLNRKGMLVEWRKVKSGKSYFEWRIWRWINYLRWRELFKISE